IVYEAVRRLITPSDVHGGLVLALAGVGIVVNIAAAVLLAGPSRKSLNVRGAFLHVTTDVAAFAGTAIAGALILATGWDRFDPLASLAVAGLIFWSSAVLLRESSRILLEISPGEMPPDEVAEAMLAVPDVVEVHDLHVWTVGSGFPALSAHVLVQPEGAPAPSREERKVITVLFADLVGFTSRAEKLDPEDVRAMLSPYYARLRHELERHGGTVEKFIGDAVVALFGAPVAHEDDPERAVRAALAIREAI